MELIQETLNMHVRNMIKGGLQVTEVWSQTVASLDISGTNNA